MSDRRLAAVVTVATLALVALTPLFAAAQSTSAAAPPRTPWGHPDLQGVWDFSTITPLERPDDLAGKEFWTEEEAADLERQALDRIERDAQPSVVRTEPLPVTGSVGAYNLFWFGPNLGGGREPADFPDSRPAGWQAPLDAGGHGETQRSRGRERAPRPRPGGPHHSRALHPRVQLRTAHRSPGLQPERPALPDSRPPGHPDRDGPRPRASSPLDGRPHVAEDIRQWRGDSRARWEGDTLVVETANFYLETWMRGFEPEHAPGRALPPRRHRLAALRVHGRGSDHVDEPVDGAGLHEKD